MPWTFKSWITNFKEVDLPIGDLARDIINDSNFPKDDTFGIIHEYICYKTTSSEVIETFVTTWNFYLATK
ncbi:hypothetical protein KY55_10390 [Clostridium tetani]|nr:hypothetical protein KY55_10390 [Clostridium tetani]